MRELWPIFQEASWVDNLTNFYQRLDPTEGTREPAYGRRTTLWSSKLPQMTVCTESFLSSWHSQFFSEKQGTWWRKKNELIMGQSLNVPAPWEVSPTLSGDPILSQLTRVWP